MPKKVASLAINLLPGREPAFSATFLNWVLSAGRYIIIGTEIIVLVAFLSRFKLDRDLIDLNDHVEEKQKILRSLSPVEERVTQLQKRLSEIKKIDEGQGSGILALPHIATLTPSEITYSNISVAGDKITILGNALETADISRFVASLKTSPLFKKETVSLEKIEHGKTQEEALSFTISAIIEEGQ